MILGVEPCRDLTRFYSAYSIDTDVDAPRPEPSRSPVVAMTTGEAALDQLLGTIGGMSFGRGLYRVHKAESVEAWSTTIATAWKETANRIKVFAYDWLGRQFALYKEKTILQFSAGDLEFVNIPASLFPFHDEEAG